MKFLKKTRGLILLHALAALWFAVGNTQAAPTFQDIEITDAAPINETLNAGENVTLSTDAGGPEEGNITLSASILKSAGPNATLTLKAAGNILITGDVISSSGGLDLVITAGGDITINGKLHTNGGDVHLQSKNSLLLNSHISTAGTRQEAGSVTASSGNLLYNTGTIKADGVDEGGTVSLTAKTIMHAGTISTDGKVKPGSVNINFSKLYTDMEAAVTSASSTKGSGGAITIEGGEKGRLFTSGSHRAMGHGSNGIGGTIHLLGNEVLLIGARVDASGNLGGGTVLAGGDFHGKGSVMNASYTEVNFSASIKADALKNGKGGKVIIWADKETKFGGSVSAKGGENGGDGGLVEVSGKDNASIGGEVVASAAKGLAGTAHFDPKNIVIDDATGSSTVGFKLTDPNPNGTGFGNNIVPLSTGNIVVVDSTDNAAATDAGAVYLYNGTTGALISTLTGSTASDQVGSDGVTALTNGNYVVASQYWDNVAAFIVNAGAVTWSDGSTGITGVVSTTNSLYGPSSSDQVGRSGVTALTNGNYVVASNLWDNGATANVGAVTWGNGSTGITGAVTTANSLYGSTANDYVGTNGVTALTNGNYVVRSSLWNNGGTADAGAVTWGDGSTGITGAVSTTNSLYGSTTLDYIGLEDVIALTNGNYVVASQNWDNGAVANAGAVTWGDGSTGTTGAVSTANSLYGTTASDGIGREGVTALTNGNYVVASSQWNNGGTTRVGAVTWGNGSIGTTGAVSTANSLYGTTANDWVGNSGVTALSNGNYVVASGNWDNGATANVGAVTWGDGSTGTTGAVSTTNSLYGTSSGDQVGIAGVTALTNGNYVVASPWWDNGTANIGAATFVDGSAAFSGAVSASNSLYGTTGNDMVGGYASTISGVTALTNGNYVVASSLWNNGGTADAGAVTWGDGSTGITGAVSTTNSLYGSSASDGIGLRAVNTGGVIALTNGNYIVVSNLWDNGATVDAGAVTFGGSTGITGAISSTNSIVGASASSTIGTPVSDSTNNAFIVNFNSGGSDDVIVGLTSPTQLTYGLNEGGTITMSTSFLTDTLNKGTAVTLQASNDITVSSPITVNNPTGNGGDLTLQAGRSILINANITTDNGALTLIANDLLANGVVDAYRDAGAAAVTMAGGAAIDAGTGNVTVDLRDGTGKTNSTSGTMTLGTVTTTGTVTVLGAPTVSATTPTNGATGVAANAAITATFSEAMNPATLTTSTFTVSGGVTGTVTYNSGTNTATFTPSGNLAYGTTYTATITTGATDAVGNALASNYTWSFTTEAAPATVPGAPTSVTATAGNAQATISFTAPASDGGSAITGYTVTSNPGGITATGTASPITVTSLTNGTAYTFTVTATNSVGTGSASSASNSVTPVAPISTYTVTPSAGTGGSISPSTAQTVNSGSTTTFTVAPNVGYAVSVGGTCGGSLSGTTYTTNAITSDCTVTASFTVNTYTVTPSAGSGGSISPSTARTINYGSTTTFTVTPNAGYTASVGGTCGGSLSGTTYTTNAITASCTVTASFTLSDATAPTTTAAPKGGTFNASQSVTLSCADNSGGTGCSKTYYTTNGTTPTASSPVYSSAISISSTTTLKFFSTDLTGNSESVKTETYTIDKTPPVLSIPPEVNFTIGLGQTSVVVPIGTATATDENGAATVTNDAQNYKNGSAEFSVGVSTVTWTATDAAGNKSTGTQEVTVFVPPGGDELLLFKTTADGQRITETVTLSTNTSGVLNMTRNYRTHQLSLTATYSNGSTEDVTNLFSFASTNSKVAPVDSKGIISAVADGNATVKATYNGQTAPVDVMVNLAESPVTTTIPAMPQWGLALLGVLLFICGIFATEHTEKKNNKKWSSAVSVVYLALFMGLLFPQFAPAATGKAMAKAGYIRLLTQSQPKSPFTPPNAGALSEEALFQAVLDLMKSKGIPILEGLKGTDPLTREEYINLTYAFLTGEKGNSTIENKFFLKEKGIIDPDDIGAIKSFEGEVKAYRSGSKGAIKITGSEPVLFQDIDETEEGSRIELVFDDLSVLTIGEEARIEINKMVYDPVKNTREVVIQQHVGKMRVKVSKIDAAQTNFTIKTPTAVIGVRGTEFVTNVGRDGKTDVVTISGLVGIRPVIPQKEDKGEKKEEKKKEGEGEKGGEQAEEAQGGDTKEGEKTGESKGEPGGGETSEKEKSGSAGGGAKTSGSGGKPETGGGEVLVGANSSVSVSKKEGLGQVQAVSAESMKTVLQETTVQKPIVVKGGGTVTATEVTKTITVVAQVAKAAEGEKKKEETGRTEEKGKGEKVSEKPQESKGSTPGGALEETKKTEPLDSKNLVDQTGNTTETKANETTFDNADKEKTQEKISDADGDGISDKDDLFPKVAQTKSGMSTKIGTDSGENTMVVDPDLAAAMMKENLDQIAGTGVALDPVNSVMATKTEIQDGDFIPSAYSYGLQVEKDYMNSSALDSIESSSFLSYAVQVEEDYLNWAALNIYRDFADSLATYYDSIDAANASTGKKDRVEDSYFLRDTIQTKLENGNIRERDAYLAQEADAKAGRVLKDAHGNWVRVQQYVLTPDDYSVEVLNVNLRGSGAGDLSGLTYMDWKTVFSDSIGGVNLTTLPWGDWLNTLGTNLGGTDPLRVLNPSNYGLRAMGVSFVGPQGGIFEGRVFNGIGADGYQRISEQGLTIYNAASGSQNEFGFNPDPVDPTGDMTYYTALAGADNPQGFKYVINDEGTTREINVNFYVLGNSTTPASEGTMSSGYGTVVYQDIWAALGTGTSSSMPSIGSHAKGFGDNGQIGNNLEIRFQDGTNSSLLGTPVDLVYIPLPTMEWKTGEW